MENSEGVVGKKHSKWGLFPVTVEPALVVVIFMGACADGVITNLFSSRVCSKLLNYTEAMCDGAVLEDRVEQRIQPYTSSLQLAKTIIETLPPVFFSLFVGPWTDSNGRKPFIILPMIGYVLAFVAWGCLSMMDISPYFLLLAPLPIPLTGGLVAMVTSCNCYLTDVSDEEERPYRLSVLEAAINLGMLLGFFSSPYLFSAGGKYGYVTVFFSTACLTLICCLCLIFFLPESIRQKKAGKGKIYNLDHIRDTYKVISAKRPNHGKSIILLVVAIYSLKTLVIEGESGVRFLSVRRVFSWNLHQFTTYVVINMIVVFVGSWLGSWLLITVLRLPDIPTALGVFLTLAASSVGMSFSSTPVAFYITTNLCLLRSVTGPLITSHILKIVPKGDIGKVFAFLLTVAAVTPQLAALAYNGIYGLIEGEYPMMIYMVTTALLVMCIIMCWVIIHLEKGKPNFSKTGNENQMKT